MHSKVPLTSIWLEPHKKFLVLHSSAPQSTIALQEGHPSKSPTTADRHHTCILTKPAKSTTPTQIAIKTIPPSTRKLPKSSTSLSPHHNHNHNQHHHINPLSTHISPLLSQRKSTLASQTINSSPSLPSIPSRTIPYAFTSHHITSQINLDTGQVVSGPGTVKHDTDTC